MDVSFVKRSIFMTSQTPPKESGPSLEGLDSKNYGLTSEQETFLFGDQGAIPSDEDAFSIWHYKMGLAREWLASFVPISEVPKETVANMHDAHEQTRKLFGSDMETFGVSTPHPVAYAIWVEQNSSKWVPLDKRPQLINALVIAEASLDGDPEKTSKLEYVMALFEESDRKAWNSGRQGGDMSPTRFPEPVDSYRQQAFPVGLAGTELLF
jgi:hypothetical protein